MVTSQAIIKAARLPFTAGPDSPEAVTLLSALPAPLLDAVTTAKDQAARTLAINDCGLWLAYHWQGILPGMYGGKFKVTGKLQPMFVDAPALRAFIAEAKATPWPLPWRCPHAQTGTFGDIVAANGEPVAQVHQLSPKFAPDIVKRNQWRNVVAQQICDVINEAAAIVAELPEE